jgi:phosphatidylglycerophosphate synthase
MFDAKLRPLIDPPLNHFGRGLARLGVGANAVTLIGAAIGLAAGLVIANGLFWTGLGLIIANRLLDGLDGAIARATNPSDFGGYLDIVADFAFYVAVPVGFGFAAADNLPAALVLVAAFTLTGISFLSFAVIAAKRGLETTAHGQKSFFYNTGLAEGTETIAAFVLMCLLPTAFPIIALLYAALCIATVIQRSIAAYASFR